MRNKKYKLIIDKDESGQTCYKSFKINNLFSTKIFTTILILFTIIKFSSGQEVFYYYEGKKIPLKTSTNKIYIKFEDNKDESEMMKIITENLYIKSSKEKNILQPNNVAFIDIEASKSSSDIINITKDLNKNKYIKDIVIANPFLIYALDSTLLGITERFVVKLKSPTDFPILEKLAEETNTYLSKQDEYDPSIYTLIADKNSNGNALEMANYFYETGTFEFSEPIFVKLLKQHCSDDPYFDQQWGLKNTGQYSGIVGADIDICGAWEITRGSSNISVAVLDEGVDLNHPDLKNNLLPGFDFTGLGGNGAPRGNDAHGTACAGIIAAEGNNSEGISGIAPNCKIMPIRIAYTSGSNWISYDDLIANAINWAVNQGADILSNSWSSSSPSAYITNAINNAVNNGRGGLGCVVLFSAGNDNSSVSYPANLSNVIAVGAMNMCNERKTPTGCDGERTWGSNYGNTLSVMAPGVKIYTTDISGSYGYNSGNYTSTFNGTSSACPHAAGVMALILSVNRCLSATEARRILELSCDKVGPYCYSPGKQNGSWNSEMGYGRINAANAVKYALSLETNMFFNIGGDDQGAGATTRFILSSGGCSGLAAGMYMVKQHEIRKTVNYSYTQAPIIVGSVNGFSGANPNVGDYYMQVVNLTPTSATLRTWVYEVVSTISGQSLSWIPTSPGNVRFNFTILSSMEMDIYLQNQSISSGTYTHNAMNKIEVGNNVTTSVPTGNYVVGNNASVILHAGNIVKLKPGTTISAKTSNSRIYVNPFFTCSQYPRGIISQEHGYPPVNIDYKVERRALTTEEEIDIQETNMTIYPNPSRGSFTLEYNIQNSDLLEITIIDNCGRPVYKLKNKSSHDAGIYQIEFSGIDLPTGVYHCVLQNGSKINSQSLIITK